MASVDTDTTIGTDRRSILKLGATLGTLGITGLAGCADNGSSNKKNIQSNDDVTQDYDSLPTGGTFVIGAQQGIQTMVPFQGFLADYLVAEMMYDRLTRVDQNFEVQPNLAKDWEINDDYTVFTFMLEENAMYSNMDGETVTAEDVKATYDYLTSDDFSGSPSSLSGVNEVEVIDETTVEITLDEPDLNFTKRISETGGAFFIVPKSILDEDPSKLEDTDYGSGPLELTEWNQQNNITFTAASDYHIDGVNGDPLPYVDKIEWDILSDEIQRANALSDGSIDAVSRIGRNVTDRVQGDAQLVKQTSGLQYPIVLNTTVEPLDDPNVRKAIKYALDREEILEGVTPEGVLGLHAGVTPVHTYYNDELDTGDTFGTTADTEKAQEMLDQAGYSNGLEIQQLHYDDGVPAKEIIAQLFQQQMKEVGIEFEINRLTEETWLADYWNQDGVWYITNYSTRVLGSTVPQLALRSDGPWNEANWSNEAYDEAFQRAASATDEETKAEALKECQKISHREGAWVGTFHPQIYGGYQSYVKNYNLYPTYIKDFVSRCAVDK
ncbi:ABC transporter substrate-binding protein [Natrinema caseinilyticum]|uniref:ABC transporter substrate-binding protein n=1 Tax=Natrinema caseinilyticum TaxID=2961570 RepID=UPI0020C3DF06|nr:ABC transporter substrate-binding protein [Natrinema caseinilyticum]